MKLEYVNVLCLEEREGTEDGRKDLLGENTVSLFLDILSLMLQ